MAVVSETFSKISYYILLNSIHDYNSIHEQCYKNLFFEITFKKYLPLYLKDKFL